MQTKKAYNLYQLIHLLNNSIRYKKQYISIRYTKQTFNFVRFLTKSGYLLKYSMLSFGVENMQKNFMRIYFKYDSFGKGVFSKIIPFTSKQAQIPLTAALMSQYSGGELILVEKNFFFLLNSTRSGTNNFPKLNSFAWIF